MQENIQFIKALFSTPSAENSESTPLQDGRYYGGVYNGRKYMYSSKMLETLSPEKFQSFVKKQIGI